MTTRLYHSGIQPRDLGLPWAEYRPNQIRALQGLESTWIEHEVACLSAPTGTGKSAIGLTCLLSTPTGRSCIVTGTKGLEEQYVRDAKGLGEYVLNVHGAVSYECPSYGTCQQGVSLGCSRGQCEYRLRVESARQDNRGIITNYWFLAAHEDVGNFGHLVLDEAHDLEDVLTEVRSITVTEHLAEDYGLPFNEADLVEWVTPCERAVPVAEERLRSAKKAQNRRAVQKYGDQVKILRDLLTASYEEKDRKVLSSESPCWVLDCSEAFVRSNVIRKVDIRGDITALLSKGERSALMSATLSRGQLADWGLGDVPYIEIPSTFRPDDAPIYIAPVAPVTYKSGDQALKDVVRAADQIVTRRLHVKGIIHTVSFERARRVYEMSRFRSRMILHGRGEPLAIALKAFQAAGPGTILVSPSVMTGYDFPGDQANYQIIIKVPWPNDEGAANLYSARKKMRTDYVEMAIARLLDQGSGRINRAFGDVGETFILDAQASWFVPKYKRYFSRFFRSRMMFLDKGAIFPPPLIASPIAEGLP